MLRLVERAFPYLVFGLLVSLPYIMLGQAFDKEMQFEQSVVQQYKSN